MQCGFCGTPIEHKSAWKGARHRFYCSEFCADSEESATAPAAATLSQLHRERPYERLERLLPYMRQYSGRALAAAPTREGQPSRLTNGAPVAA
jgi:hypothetical protein